MDSITTQTTEAGEPAPGTPEGASPPAGREGRAEEIVIRGGRGWQPVNLRELWRYREILFFLCWRDIKVRYKQAALGAAWAVLQPLATMAVFSLFFSRLAGEDVGETPYPLFVLCGLLPWTFLANAISSAAHSVVGSQALITKVYFPRLLIPTGAVGAVLVDFAIGVALLLPVVPWYARPGWQVLLLPPLVLGLLLTALGVGTLLAALAVSYRDFRHVVPFMMQMWMLCTPSIYLPPGAAASVRWQAVLPLNPAYGLIKCFRAAALGGPVDLYALGVSAGVAAALLLAGCLLFRRAERTFADLI